MRKTTKHTQKLDTNLLNDLGVDLSTGRLFLTGEVCEAMYVRTLTGLAALNQAARTKRLTVCLNTLGGDVYQAFAIYDLIRLNHVPVDIHVNGPCLSAGVIILQSAQGRAATSNSYLMVHEGSESIDGESLTVHKTVEHFKGVNNRARKIIADRVKVSEERVQKWFERDKYFNAKAALKAGLIDMVLE